MNIGSLVDFPGRKPYCVLPTSVVALIVNARCDLLFASVYTNCMSDISFAKCDHHKLLLPPE